MDTDKRERKILNEALDQWQKDGLLSPEKAEELRATFRSGNETRQQLSQYFFVIAISCSLLAFGAIFIDEKFLETLKKALSLSNAVIAIASALVGGWWWWRSRRHRERHSQPAYEFYAVLGALALLTSLVYICKDIGNGPAYTSLLMGAAAVLFSGSLWLRSYALWIGALLALMGWFGAFSTLHSSGNKFLGMNYPMRFTMFGMLVLGLSFLQSRSEKLKFTRQLTYIAGLLIFFTGFWGVSIFGNYGYLDEWEKVKQTHILYYGLLFGAVSVLVFLLGLKKQDDAARDFGLLFLLLNLYTRYFEYFWNTMHKGLFFLILAVSFWFIGRWVEKERKKWR